MKYQACAKDNLLLWGDKWCIEKDKAWFVSGMYNILFCLNLKSFEYESAIYMPDNNSFKFRLTQVGIKNGNSLFCMPDNGNSIWKFDIVSEKFTEIQIKNPDQSRLQINDLWEYNNKLIAVSNGLGKILEIDTSRALIENEFLISNRNLSKSIVVGTSIFSLSGIFNEIYQFDLLTKKRVIYKLPEIGRKFYTLCFDGQDFWLSGYHKEVYLWNKDKNTIKTINDFPDGFGIYNFCNEAECEIDHTKDEYEVPAFAYSVVLGEIVWFIPFQTNKIIYVVKKDNSIRALEIDEEKETKESLLKRTSVVAKYLLEYVREDRYIGLYSLKNNCILEVDTYEKKYELKYYTLSNRCKCDLFNIYRERIFCENDNLQRWIFETALIDQDIGLRNKIRSNVGKSVYEVS